MTMFCNKPDRDEPKLVCGYPIPCPYHTVVIDLDPEMHGVASKVSIPDMADPRTAVAATRVARALSTSKTKRKRA